MLVDSFDIQAENVVRDGDAMVSTYDYQTSAVERSAEGNWSVRSSKTQVQFKTNTKVPKLG